MKSFIAAVLIFTLAVGLVIANAIYSNNVCGKLAELARSLGKSEEKDKIISQIEDIWNKNRPLLDLSVEAKELMQMNEYITGLSAAHRLGHESELDRYCTLISELCEEFTKHESLSFESIC